MFNHYYKCHHKLTYYMRLHRLCYLSHVLLHLRAQKRKVLCYLRTQKCQYQYLFNIRHDFQKEPISQAQCVRQ